MSADHYMISWTWQEHVQDPLTREPAWHSFARDQRPDTWKGQAGYPMKRLVDIAQRGCDAIYEQGLQATGEVTRRNLIATILHRIAYDEEHAGAWSVVASIERGKEISETFSDDRSLAASYAVRDMLSKTAKSL